MELKLITQNKTKLKIGIKGETHTFCNVLRRELFNDDKVAVAGYNLEHSLDSFPVFIVETDSGSPKASLLKAAERLKKKTKDLREQIKKSIK